MTFFEAIRAGFRHYADFTGRAGRSEFWWWILFTALVSAALSAIPVWTIQMPDGGVRYGNSFTSVWSIVVLLPTLGLIVRRLRDAGHGWGNLFWLLVPVAGLIILAVLCARPSQETRMAAGPTPPPGPIAPAAPAWPAAPAGSPPA